MNTLGQITFPRPTTPSKCFCLVVNISLLVQKQYHLTIKLKEVLEGNLMEPLMQA